MRKRLTNSAVEAFTCGVYTSGKRKGERKPQDILWDSEVRGLGLRLSAKTGTRTYVFVHRVRGGREVYITIGRHNDGWRLGSGDPKFDPRARAQELKLEMRRGVNPVEREEQERAAKREQETKDKALATTLRETLASYLAHKTLRPATVADMKRHVEVNLEDWIDRPVSQITRNDCLAKFTAITERGAPQQANACMIYLRALLNFARESHATDDGAYPILAVNPVTAMFRLRKANPEQPRTRRIPLERIGHVWNMLRKRAKEARTDHERTACDWVSTMVLTGMRATESGSLLREDVDLQVRTIRLRSEVVKNHHGMLLSMSTALHEILSARLAANDADTAAARRRRRDRSTSYLFPSFGKKRPYISDARATMEAVAEVAGCFSLDKNGNKKYELSPHDLRRGLDDIAQACKIDSDTRRMLLNHIDGDVHFKHYVGRQNLAEAAEAIGKYVTDAALAAASSNVLPFPTKKMA